VSLAPFGVRDGVVTESERARAITFRQSMTLRLGAGIVDVTPTATRSAEPHSWLNRALVRPRLARARPSTTAGRNVARTGSIKLRYWLLCRSKGAGRADDIRKMPAARLVAAAAAVHG